MYFYLAGAMRGYPDLNFPQFREYAYWLRAYGYHILSPAELPPPNAVGPHPGRADCLRHDLHVLSVVNGVIVLPNWADSPGARLEVAAAWAFDIPVYEAEKILAGTYAWPVGEPNWQQHMKPFELDRTSVVIPREKQYYEKRPLVGLSGYAGAGKDAVASALTTHFGFERVAFADPLKDVATALGWNGEKDDAGRRFLQDLGVGVREHLNTDAWVLAAEERIERTTAPVVVTDVRFPNEVKMLRRRGGRLIRIARPGFGAVNEHVSEHLVNEDDCDAIFFNDGTLEDLPGKVEQFFFNQPADLTAA